MGEGLDVFDLVAAAAVKAQSIARLHRVLRRLRELQAGIRAGADSLRHNIKPLIHSVEQYLAEAHIRRVVHDLARKIVPHIIADERLIEVRPMQRPLVEGIHPQHGDIARGRTVVRQRLDKIAVLIKIARGVASHSNVNDALKRRRVGGVIVALGMIHHRDGRAQQRSAVRRSGEGVVASAPVAVADGHARDRLSACVDEHERQMRAERLAVMLGTGCIGGALKMLMIAWVLIGQHG